MIHAVALVASVATVLIYLGAARAVLPLRVFHAVNAVGAVPIGASAYVLGAYPSLLLTVAFGISGLVGLLSREKK